MRLECSSEVIEATLRFLQEAGRLRRECVVLWLGKRGDRAIHISRVYRPQQNAKSDMFHIPQAGMAALHDELRKGRLMVAAQVHSHPLEAFHSRADDEWAIVRHDDALSLVVPYFASTTTVHNFMQLTKVFKLSSAARWAEVPSAEVSRECLQII